MLENKFDYLAHYRSLYFKYTKFIKDFKLLAHIATVEITRKNPYDTCRFEDNEPVSHANAKNKIFELFLRNRSYLVEAELRPVNKQLNVPHKGDRDFQFDLLVMNVANFTKLHTCIMNMNSNIIVSNLKELKQTEQSIIFAIELDGTSHSDPKDKLRDDFFFDEYNIVTVRYRVDELVKIEETEKERKARVKFSFFKYKTDPIFEHITTDQIVQEVRNIYRTKYPHL